MLGSDDSGLATSSAAPGPKLSSRRRRLRTEAAILGELVRRGYKVLIPFGTNQRYDLVFDLDGDFARAQCKTGRMPNKLSSSSSIAARISRSMLSPSTRCRQPMDGCG